MSSAPNRIGVVGGGAWGTALACAAVHAGAQTLIYAREEEVVTEINADHINTMFLPDRPLPAALRATGDMGDLAGTDLILLVAPTQSLRTVVPALVEHIGSNVPVLACSKGIDRQSGLLPTQVMGEVAPDVIAGVLSGPSFAVDVAAGLPTAVTVAGPDLQQAEQWSSMLASEMFRPYASDDLIGVQIGGALKNVLAIACGIAEGKGLGLSARAGLIARGFAELRRLANAMGARDETLMGLSGLGDLVLTCSSPTSRNFALGLAIGAETKRPAKLAEGALTAKVAVEKARELNVSLPVCEAVLAVLDNRLGVNEAMHALLTRPLKAETT